jgi:hypothetical protein
MAYSPIALIAPNYRDYGSYWLKAYTPGSTSPKSLSIDPVATTLFSKLQLNVDGFFKSAGGALITPHIEGSYDAYLFATLEEAEANNTAAAIRVADNITPVTTTGSIGFTITTAGLKSTNSIFAANTVIMTSGYTTSGDNGKGRWKQTGVTGLTPSQSPSQLFGALLTDGLGNQWALINDGTISISQLGGLVGSNNGAVVFAFNASSATTLDLEGLTWPARDIDCDNATDKAQIQKSFINGTLIVVNSFVNDVDLQTIQPFSQDEITVSGKKSQTLTWKDKRVLWLGTSIPHQGADSDGYPELLSSTLDFTVSNWSWSGSHAFYDIAGDAFDSGTVRALSMTEADRLAGLALYGSTSAYDDSFNNVTIASQMTAEYRIKNQFVANPYDVVVLDHNHNDRKSVQTYTVNDKTLTAITKGTTTVVAVNNTTGLTVGDGAYLEVTGFANLQYAAARITAISSLDVTLAIDSSAYAGTFISGTLHWVDRNTLEGSFDFLIAYTKNMGIIYGNTSVDIVLCNAPSYFTNNTNRDYSIWSSGKTIKKVADKWALGYFDVAATLDLIYSQHLIYFPDEIHPSTLETRKVLAAYWAEWMSGGKQTVVNHAETLAKNKLVLDAHQELAVYSKYDNSYAYRANLFTDDTPAINENFSGGIGTWTVTSTPPVIEAAPWGAGQAAKFVVTAVTPQPFIAKTSALAFDPILEFDLYFPTISLATGVSNQLTVFSLTTADLTTYNVAVIQSVGGTARLNVSRSDTNVVSVNMPTYLIEAATKYTIKVDIIKGDTTSSDGYVLITVNGVKLYAAGFANGGISAVTSTVVGAIFNNMGSDFNFFISNIVTGGKTRRPSVQWPEIQNARKTPETFGAVGDGVVDDTSAFVAGVVSNSTLYLQDNKTYLVNALLFDSINNFKLVGAENAVIKLAAAQTDNVLYFSNSTHIKIDGVEIDGNRPNQTGYYGEDDNYAIWFQDCDFTYVDNCTIANTIGGGVRGRDCSMWHVRNNYITNVGAWPISCYLGAASTVWKNYIMISGNYVDWEDQSYMVGQGDPSKGWDSNTPPRPICFVGGVSSDSDQAKTTNINIINNTFYQKNTGGDGAFIAHVVGKNWRDRLVSNNKLYGGGMGISGGKNCINSIITDNTIKVPTSSTMTDVAYGIEGGAQVVNTHMSGNMIDGGGHYITGIQQQDSSGNVVIEGGTIEGCLDFAVTYSNTAGTGNTNLILRPGHWKGGSTGSGVVRIDGVESSSVTGGILDGAGVAVGAIEYILTSNVSSVSGVTFINPEGSAFVRLRQQSGVVKNISVIGCSVPVLDASDRYLRNQTGGTATLGAGIKYTGCTNGYDILDLSNNIISATDTGTPQGNIVAGVGSRYFRTDGGAGTTFYVKETLTTSSGWVGK